MQKFLCMVGRVKKNIVVVFDLDDTLYSEYDYQISGIKAVAREIIHLYGRDVQKELLNWHGQGERDVLGRVCQLLMLPEEVKDSLIWVYRLHNPDIELDCVTAQVFKQLREVVGQLAILTDGRSVSQRKKIDALGLSDLPVYISEEYASEKPHCKRFKAIMYDYPFAEYCYIGDNPSKDFFAPNELGWLTIGMRSKGGNIHSQNIKNLSQDYLPDLWIDSFFELLNLFDIKD
jgi:putative hydrolase of the HAD superfamily